MKNLTFAYVAFAILLFSSCGEKTNPKDNPYNKNESQIADEDLPSNTNEAKQTEIDYSTGYGYVIQEKIFFHTKPSNESKNESFLVEGQPIMFSQYQNGFVLARYVRKLNVTEGWINVKDLKLFSEDEVEKLCFVGLEMDCYSYTMVKFDDHIIGRYNDDCSSSWQYQHATGEFFGEIINGKLVTKGYMVWMSLNPETDETEDNEDILLVDITFSGDNIISGGETYIPCP